MTRTAVVTGGGTGIGRAVAAALAADDHDVVITGRRASVLAETAGALGERVRALAFDATDPNAVDAALGELPERVDVLVNNAGGNAALGVPPAEAGDLHALRAGILADVELNLVSAVLVTEALRSRFTDGARVVNIGSIAGSRGGGVYGAAKTAVATWTVDLARQLGERGGTANVVAPGYVADTEFFGDGMTAQRKEWLVGQTFTGRAGAPEDVAATVAFLASPGAGYISGQVLHVNGGAYLGH